MADGDRLDANRFAGSYEEPHLRAHVEEDELELELLRAKSERAKRALDEADARFQAIEQQYKEHKHIRDDAAAYSAEVQRRHEAQVAVVGLRRAYFHPIRRLAAETLERIFEFTVGNLSDVGSQTTREDISARQRQPFRLAAVCRFWRRTILQAPRPWTQLELRLPVPMGKGLYSTRNSRWSSFVGYMNSRSGSSAVTLCLRRQVDGDAWADTSTITRVAELLPRCSTLLVYAAEFVAQDPLLLILTADTPQLIHAHLEFDAAAALDNLRLLPKAPLLRSLWAKNIFGLVADALPSLTDITLANLHCSAERDDVQQIFSSARKVQSVQLITPLIKIPSTADVAVVAPPLSALLLEVADDCRLDKLPRRVQFTSVSNLSLFGGYASSKYRMAFLDTVAKSVHFRSLCISSLNITSLPQLVAIIPHLHELKQLHIQNTSFTKDMLRALFKALITTGKKARTWPCTHLETICLDEGCFFADDCDPADVLSTVKARLDAATGALDAPSPLRRCVLDGWEHEGRTGLQTEINKLILAQDIFG